MATLTMDTAEITSNTEATTEVPAGATQRLQTVESENAHDECTGCQARKALEDAIEGCLDAGFDRDVISEVLAEKLWESAQIQLFGGVGACIEDGWSLADILEEVEHQYAFVMKEHGDEPEIIPACEATLVRDAA